MCIRLTRLILIHRLHHTAIFLISTEKNSRFQLIYIHLTRFLCLQNEKNEEKKNRDEKKIRKKLNDPPDSFQTH